MTDHNFFDRLKENPRPVVVDFWAPWCGPCRMIEPQLKQLGQEYDGQVDVWKVNADNNPEILKTLRIYGIPTIVIFNQGQEVARRTGAASRRELGNLFEAALSGERPTFSGLTIIDRVLRVAVGLALLLLAYTGNFEGVFLLIGILSGVAFFSAVYDRCPLWKSITAWLGFSSNDKTNDNESSA